MTGRGDNSSLTVELQFPSNLKKLQMRSTGFFQTTLLRREDTLNKLDSLQHLHIFEESDINLRRVMQMVTTTTPRACANIETLELQLGHMDRDILIQFLSLPRVQHLTMLNLLGCSEFDDKLADFVALTLKKLRSLKARSTKITGVAIKSLVKELPDLRVLDLDFCTNISPDAIEWARSQGLNVTHRLDYHKK